MRKISFLLFILLLFSAKLSFAQEQIQLPPISLPDISERIDKPGEIDLLKLNISKDKKALLNKSWNIIKGKPIDNALLLGMFSHHTSVNRDEFNESNKLLGLDFNGYSAGTFNNSWHKQTYYAGVNRKIYQFKLPGEMNFDVKYRIVGMYGYQDHYPALAGITPIIMPMFGISKEFAGTDLMIIPAKKPTFVLSFRVNLPNSNKPIK